VEGRDPRREPDRAVLELPDVVDVQNHNPSGRPSVATPADLEPAQHAVYLATVARYVPRPIGCRLQLGRAVQRPDGSWWTADGTQEGCHFQPATQRPVINYLRSELNARDLGWMPMPIGFLGYDSALSTWNSFDSTTRGNVPGSTCTVPAGAGGPPHLRTRAQAARGPI